MRFKTKLLAFAAAPLLVSGCKNAPKVENVTITNDMAVNATAPTGGGSTNDLAGNAAATP